MKHYIENDFAEFWIEGGILFFIYKDDVNIHLASATKIVRDRLSIQHGKAFPILCDIKGVKDIDKDARRYLALEGSVLIDAVALITETPLSYIISELYLKTSNPPIPTRVFTQEREALEFLATFKC